MKISLGIEFLKVKKLGFLPRKGASRRIRNFIEGLSLNYLTRGLFWDSPFKPYEIPFLMPQIKQPAEYSLGENIPASADKLNNFMLVDMQMRLKNSFLAKIDRTSMLNSLEVRCPYLDRSLVEFTFSVKSSRKTRIFSQKILLRKITAKHFPKSLIPQKKKGFSLPLKEWLRKELKEFAKTTLHPSQLAQKGYLNQKAIDFYLNQHLSGKEDLHNRIWSLITLELWARHWL